MELWSRQDARAVAVLVVLLAGCCLQGAQASQPRRFQPPSRGPGIYLPYFCPNEVTLTKLKIRQSERSYVQYTEYVTQIPFLQGFTMHYWFNLDDNTNTSTMFNYGNPSFANDILTVKLEAWEGGRTHKWAVHINGYLASRVTTNIPIRTGQWYHAIHSWDSNTGIVSHFINGERLKLNSSYKVVRSVIAGGGRGVSGQHQNTAFFGGMDQGEGFNGWLTLFHLSAKPLSYSSVDADTKAKLAFQCSIDMDGDVISWTKTPRKGFGGVTETPSFSKACGQF